MFNKFELDNVIVIEHELFKQSGLLFFFRIHSSAILVYNLPQVCLVIVPRSFSHLFENLATKKTALRFDDSFVFLRLRLKTHQSSYFFTNKKIQTKF